MKQNGCLFMQFKNFHCHNYFQLKLAVLNIFQKVKEIWVLQPALYGGSCLIQIDRDKDFYNMWEPWFCAQQFFCVKTNFVLPSTNI